MEKLGGLLVDLRRILGQPASCFAKLGGPELSVVLPYLLSSARPEFLTVRPPIESGDSFLNNRKPCSGSSVLPEKEVSHQAFPVPHPPQTDRAR